MKMVGEWRLGSSVWGSCSSRAAPCEGFFFFFFFFSMNGSQLARFSNIGPT